MDKLSIFDAIFSLLVKSLLSLTNPIILTNFILFIFLVMFENSVVFKLSFVKPY